MEEEEERGGSIGNKRALLLLLFYTKRKIRCWERDWMEGRRGDTEGRREENDIMAGGVLFFFSVRERVS